MMPNIGKYVMGVFFLILVYLVLNNAKGFNQVISSMGNTALRGIGTLQGRSSNDIQGQYSPYA